MPPKHSLEAQHRARSRFNKELHMVNPPYLVTLWCLALCADGVSSFVPWPRGLASTRVDICVNGRHKRACSPLQLSSDWTSDFEDFDSDDEFSDDEDGMQIAKLMENRATDLSGSQQRQFALGYDIVLDSFAGSMGFDEVVDWEYFDNPGEEERNVVQPPPLDPTKPKRTRSSSGSVVRVFRGEFTGRVASTLRSQGMDMRVLVKEFSGEVAVDLARAEVQSVSRIQSALCVEKDEFAKQGEWATTAANRYVTAKTSGSTQKDDANLLKLINLLASEKSDAPFVGILGELRLDDDEDMDANEWYRALSVPPPKPGSVWIVYEYAGLSTLANYAQPASVRRENMPKRRGPFGGMIEPPALPPWKERAKYVVQGILKGALEAVATLHDNGVAHRSIGRNSIILSSAGMDKMEASSPFAVVPSRLVVKLADFGFSGSFAESSLDESFRARARAFGIEVKEGTSSIAASGFAMAEDLHALGFVFLGVLLTSLAEPPDTAYKIPATDEDSLQRLLGEIFEKDMDEFRDYCEAEDIWSSVVELLDESDGAGWQLISSMCFARERAAENKDNLQLLTARGLLSSPFFEQRR